MNIDPFAYPHFAILTDNGNKSLEIATGGSANPERGPKITLGDSVTLPEFANIPANKYLVFDFDALYQNDTSNVQLCGVTEPPVAISSDLLPLSVSIAKCGYESNFCLFVPNVNLNGPKS